jgi:hypothetical protein
MEQEDGEEGGGGGVTEREAIHLHCCVVKLIKTHEVIAALYARADAN